MDYCPAFVMHKVVMSRMNTVEPIRDKKTIEDVADFLKEKSDRNYVLFMFGIYSGRRISDILKFRVRDVRNKSNVSIKEQKTGKEMKFPINDELKPIIRDYIEGKPDYEFLFKSRKGKNEPITRQQAYNILNEAADAFDLYSIGTHTMRKTLGYHMYQKSHDIELVRKILNQTDEKSTRRYIGIDQEMVDKAMTKFSFK
jgi:integrase